MIRVLSFNPKLLCGCIPSFSVCISNLLGTAIQTCKILWCMTNVWHRFADENCAYFGPWSLPGWSARDFVNGSSPIEPRSTALPSAAVGVWHQQGYTPKIGMDDRCGSSHKPRRPHDRNACAAHLRSGLSDTKPSSIPTHHNQFPRSKHPPSYACHQLHADDL